MARYEANRSVGENIVADGMGREPRFDLLQSHRSLRTSSDSH